MADDLKLKIKELEVELSEKNKELARYRNEVAKVNQVIEGLVSDMSQELKLAGLIQKLLSPTEIPNIPGIEFSSKFVPGTKSGGDYFDIFEHDDRLKFGIIVSSSSGYTMSALFLSVLMKLSAQIEARKGLSPDKVVALMAEEIVPNIQKNDSASLFYGVVDRRTYELKFSSIGSIAAVIQPHGQEESTWLQASTGPLKMGYAEKPLVNSLTLGPRDRLILCTEGVLSAQTQGGEIYGKDRLMKSLVRAPRSGVHDVRNEILYQVEKFSGLLEPNRDQTVLVTEVKDRVIKLAKKNTL